MRDEKLYPLPHYLLSLVSVTLLHTSVHSLVDSSDSVLDHSRLSNFFLVVEPEDFADFSFVGSAGSFVVDYTDTLASNFACIPVVDLVGIPVVYSVGDTDYAVDIEPVAGTEFPSAYLDNL